MLYSQGSLYSPISGATLSEIVFGSNKKNLGKSHEILLYLSTANVQLQLNLIYQTTCKACKSLVFSATNCPFFSGVSAVVLILLLGACESEEFPTAEHNKSQK